MKAMFRKATVSWTEALEMDLATAVVFLENAPDLDNSKSIAGAVRSIFMGGS